MRFLSLDMHISVAEDLATIFSRLGHHVHRESLSGHAWVNDVPRSSLRGLDRSNWKSVGPATVSKFVAKNRRKLEQFDGFIVAYPPAFALLFEQFDKPVILVTCTRFDYPTFPQNYGWLLEGLRRMHRSTQLISVANNKLDQNYNESVLGIPTKHISSLCSYLPSLPNRREGRREFVAWTRYEHDFRHELLDRNFSIKNRYNRAEVPQRSGVVHLPYNLSIMSAFEHYWQAIPMYFPTERLQREWFERDPSRTLQEVLFPRSALTFSPEQIKLADWYDPENFKGVRLFDNETELYSMLKDDDLVSLSESMFEHNRVREQRILSSWEAELEL